MRVNKREFAVEQEATPGTAETLAFPADLLVRTRDGDSIEPDFDLFDTEEVQGTSSKRPLLSGRKLLALPMSYILRGPGDLVTVPIIADMIESHMMVRKKVEKMAIGAVTGGPFVDGETVNGASASAVVFRDTANGASELKFTDRSGGFAAELLTGATSGATATSSEAEQDFGYMWKFGDSDFGGGDTKHHVTAQLNQDGFFWRARGCLANLEMVFAVGRPAVVSQRFLGAFTAHGDASLNLPATYPEESVVAGRFLNAQLQLGSYTPTDIVEVTLSSDIQPEAREDANDTAADGVLYADYDRLAPTVTLSPAMVTQATKDFFQEIQDGTTFAMEWTVGDTAGARWTFYGDTAQYSEMGADARRSLATVPITVRLNGTNNDELVIWQH